MDLTTITVAQFKAFFTRDFPYLPSNINPNSDNANQYVLDSDITKAFGEAIIAFNQYLCTGIPSITTAFLYMTAHFLCLDIRESFQGINGVGTNIVNARSVGNVSESYSIPERYLTPILLEYTKTTYGLRYLNMVAPRLVGNIRAVFGGTNA